MADQDNPLEAFRQVLTGAARAIAREPEMELGFTADTDLVAGMKPTLDWARAAAAS